MLDSYLMRPAAAIVEATHSHLMLDNLMTEMNGYSNLSQMFLVLCSFIPFSCVMFWASCAMSFSVTTLAIDNLLSYKTMAYA
jgi:hypothetical protein